DGSGIPSTVSVAEGVHLPGELPDGDLPAGARMAISTGARYGAPHLGGPQGDDLAATPRSVASAPPRARDALAGVTVRPQTVHNDLQRLRTDVRSVVGEVRETLYDMRTDVTETRGLVDALDGFLARVRQRASVETSFRHQETARLPVPQEREMWRIAQEAISNVERHASAAHLSVDWRCDGNSALLVVADD